MRVRFVRLLALLLSAWLIIGDVTSVAAQGEVDPCAAPVVLTKNCRFQIPTGGVAGFGIVYSYWNPFIVSGNVGFDAQYHGNSYDPDDLVNGGREQSIFSRDSAPWSAGVWQQVNATPGNGYFARIGWFVSQNTTIMGRVGIDPTGGTDPASPNIVWSRALGLLRQTRIIVRGVRAAGNRITVFAEATSGTPFGGGDRLWLTAVSVSPDADVVPETPTPVPPTSTPVPTATNTRIPSTRTPTRPPPTATATASTTPTTVPSATATDTPSPEPTEISVQVALGDQQPPTPGAARRTLAIANADERSSPNDILMLGLVGGAGGAMTLSLALGAVALWYWRRK